MNKKIAQGNFGMKWCTNDHQLWLQTFKQGVFIFGLFWLDHTNWHGTTFHHRNTKWQKDFEFHQYHVIVSLIPYLDLCLAKIAKLINFILKKQVWQPKSKYFKFSTIILKYAKSMTKCQSYGVFWVGFDYLKFQ